MRRVALALPDVDEGVACEGTPVEKRTVKVGKKAFLFLGTGDALLELDASLAAAAPPDEGVAAHAARRTWAYSAERRIVRAAV